MAGLRVCVVLHPHATAHDLTRSQLFNFRSSSVIIGLVLIGNKAHTHTHTHTHTDKTTQSETEMISYWLNRASIRATSMKGSERPSPLCHVSSTDSYLQSPLSCQQTGSPSLCLLFCGFVVSVASVAASVLRHVLHKNEHLPVSSCTQNGRAHV